VKNSKSPVVLLETVIDASARDIDRQVRRARVEIARDCRSDDTVTASGRSQVDIEIFALHRPVLIDTIFHATADRPTYSGRSEAVCTYEGRKERYRLRELFFGYGQAARSIYKPIIHHPSHARP
jgi:hypothetical protein